MKKLVTIASMATLGLLVSGCAMHPTVGFIYTDSQLPVAATSNNVSTVISGTSDECVSYLGLIASGNCSVQSAKENSGITKVATVDYKVTTILGLISRGRTVITGTK